MWKTSVLAELFKSKDGKLAGHASLFDIFVSDEFAWKMFRIFFNNFCAKDTTYNETIFCLPNRDGIMFSVLFFSPFDLILQTEYRLHCSHLTWNSSSLPCKCPKVIACMCGMCEYVYRRNYEFTPRNWNRELKNEDQCKTCSLSWYVFFNLEQFQGVEQLNLI